MRKKYKHPPINEVVVGVYFNNNITAMRSEHIGIFWSRIFSSLPNSSQNAPIGAANISVPDEIFPMPRYWFISNDEVYLLQIQRNALILNWRKREKRYPHFETVKNKFDKYLKEFQDFCNDFFEISEIEVARCELTYINIIENTEYFSSFGDTQRVIPSFAPPVVSSRMAPSGFNLRYDFPVSNNHNLVASLQSRLNAATGNDALYFELRASGQPRGSGKTEIDSWFDRAHDAVGDAFNSLTSPDIQTEYWKPREK